MWTLVAILLIVVLFPSIVAVLVLLAVSVLESPAFHRIGAFLGKIFPAYMPPRA
jgi:hypothetical protein